VCLTGKRWARWAWWVPGLLSLSRTPPPVPTAARVGGPLDGLLRGPPTAPDRNPASPVFPWTPLTLDTPVAAIVGWAQPRLTPALDLAGILSEFELDQNETFPGIRSHGIIGFAGQGLEMASGSFTYLVYVRFGKNRYGLPVITTVGPIDQPWLAVPVVVNQRFD
jgi:hypothetical protein